MNDTMVTLVGNAATAVEHRQTTAGVPVARFRMAATSRRFDRTRECWTDGETSFYTVRAWRGLADNVAASVAVGEPLVVHGRLRVREGEQSPERGGQRWFAVEVDAVAIGHDLSRGTAAFRRVSWARTDLVPQQQGEAAEPPTVTNASTATNTSAAAATPTAKKSSTAATPAPAPTSAPAPTRETQFA